MNYIFHIIQAKLCGADGRLRALDAQLAQVEAHKRDVEQKLNSVISTLRRIAGVQLDGSVSMPYRLLSPTRRWSPARSTLPLLIYTLFHHLGNLTHFSNK